MSQWKQICYDIAQADEAVDFALAIQEGTSLNKKDELISLINKVNSLQISATFRQIGSIKDELATCLRKFVPTTAFFEQTSSFNLNLATAHVREATSDAVALAESLYRHAALRDANCGCGWLRLARLKWLIGHYREAIEIIFGESPSLDLDSCQLPLKLAVEFVGGKLSFPRHLSSTWNSKAGNIEVLVDGKDLILEFTKRDEKAGNCLISGLDQADLDLLAEFFNKHQPAMFKAPETKSPEEWVSLIQAPNLGWRRAIAAAVKEDKFPLLTSCVHFGLPPVLNLSKDGERDEQLSKWREMDVIVDSKGHV